MNSTIQRCALAALLSLAAFPAASKEYLMASYPGIAPYIIQQGDVRTGIEIDVVEEAMAAMGHSVKFVAIPFGRAIKEFKAGKVDGALTISQAADLDLGEAHFSDNHITFQNVAISLTERDLDIPDIGSLSNYAVASFEFAKQYLGDDFAAMANANERYREMIPDTRPIPPTLYAGRADVVVIEINIFKHHLKNEDYSVPTDKPITIHTIFDENPFTVAFTDPKVRDDFNEGLQIIRENGVYQAIFERYVGE
jgi:polar amino acid transport system substrate-binding protein